ncbi:MAG: hypothetical protein Q8P58_01400 [Candidatus Adlerbacteria bacterium]|nr:hypothetical protein [Candidatus Adlerbacteria bacterium]
MIKVVAGRVSVPAITISPMELLALATTQALFGAQTYTFAGAFTGENKEEFLELVPELKKSPHTFVFEEEKLLKKETDALVKAGAKIETIKTEKKEWKFDQYGVASALGTRDKKKLWLGLMAAFAAGEKAEAVGGLLAWKARQMKDANLSRELTFMYHDSHRGAGDLELLLERFALKL